jgi:hypothetical protein
MPIMPPSEIPQYAARSMSWWSSSLSTLAPSREIG